MLKLVTKFSYYCHKSAHLYIKFSNSVSPSLTIICLDYGHYYVYMLKLVIKSFNIEYAICISISVIPTLTMQFWANLEEAGEVAFQRSGDEMLGDIHNISLLCVCFRLSLGPLQWVRSDFKFNGYHDSQVTLLTD